MTTTKAIGRTIALFAAGAGVLFGAHAAGNPGIYSCVDASGKKLTSDRPIAECQARDQRVLNPDGSVKRILPPTLTAEERADQEERERQEATARAARNDAIRRDRNLVQRYPNEAAHNKAREKALDDVRNSVRLSEQRVSLLTAERKPLLDEAEFYVGKPLPGKLKSALDANDAALAAQRALVQNQQQEVVRINAIYDAELARLKKLWAGAPAGSVGTPSVAMPAPAPVPARVGYK
ncbi:hypothetical protein [Piscinibacter koreensis]|uniref:DUF4124 domain-containing protein n=1 Tax=Piscinibacter koreensis TaxID=2742824 RepID=A0A7Y6NJS0_9BURK|nr:hypothetical protein [Schlegelella koreensis]NUZ04437.1 hypothetical protein [Schlegelella koreensis]